RVDSSNDWVSGKVKETSAGEVELSIKYRGAWATQIDGADERANTTTATVATSRCRNRGRLDGIKANVGRVCLDGRGVDRRRVDHRAIDAGCCRASVCARGVRRCGRWCGWWWHECMALEQQIAVLGLH